MRPLELDGINTLQNCFGGTTSLRAGQSGDRISVAARYSTSIQNGPGSHPASYTVGTGFFSGVQRPGRGVDQPLLSDAEVKERVELYLYSPSAFSWPVLMLTFTFTLLPYVNILNSFTLMSAVNVLLDLLLSSSVSILLSQTQVLFYS